MKDIFNALNIGGLICFILFLTLPFISILLMLGGVKEPVLTYLIYAAFGFFGIGFVMWLFVAAEAGKCFGQGLACMIVAKAMKDAIKESKE